MNNKYYNFGYSNYGPFLFGFSGWLMNSAFNKNTNFNKIFFFARDGFMMKKAIDILNKDKTIDNEYVYFSRKSIRQALLYKTNSFKESLKYISKEKYITYGKLLEYYGFNYKESKTFCIQGKININEDLNLDSILTNKIAQRIYNNLRQDIYNNSKQQAVLLLKYLEQINFKGNVGIVDIGWHGSMQYYLEEFVREHDLNCNITGFYLGTETIPEVKGKTFGYIYSNDCLAMKKDLLCCFGLLERLFQSREGSTFGYKLDDQKNVTPVLDTYEYDKDKQIISHIKEMQEGALEYIRQNCKKGDLKKENLILPLIRVGKKPTLRETYLFKDYYLMDGAKLYFVAQKPLFKYKPQEFVHALSNSPWKTGFMKSIFKIPFPYYKIYDLLKK